jgi:putative Holliday junction resolvase
MRIAGLDIGDVRIGIALSDERGILASSVESHACSGILEKDARDVAAKIDSLKAGAVVLGLPINMNGTEGPSAQKVRLFAQALSTHTNARISFFDERLTTAQARRTLIDANVSRKKRKQVIDKLAAQIILQNYLDAQGGY